MRKVFNTVCLLFVLIFLLGSINPIIAYQDKIQTEINQEQRTIDFLKTVLSTVESESAENDINAAIINLKKEIIVKKLELQEYEGWKERYVEYPEATIIWLYMRELGWSEPVCAGIMGNIMVEVGGSTLNLIYAERYGDYYYGICQWSPEYCPEVQGASLKDQLIYLEETVPKELDKYGWVYADWLNYETFLELEDEQDVALAFAKCYERCESFSYVPRQLSATAALQYFTLD